jgi:nitroimidazol reductase NimA-like FMN-containing flavoprotein (pyridoxamine 5'-phosphate oxidase superfamily)
MVEMWPDSVDEILGEDQAVALAHVTPAKGVVLTPVTNFALRDRTSGTVAVNSSVGMWRKLEGIRQNPHVAVAFHTREHAATDRPEYVLVQGKASLSQLEDRDGWLEAMGDNWERFGGQSRTVGRGWEWWLSAYHWRVNIEIAVERVMVWPNLACAGHPDVYGAPRPAEPPQPQRPPARGTGPRIDHARAAKKAASLPHVLLGWVGADELPMVVPVDVGGAEERGIVVEAPAGLIPPGGRRAGLLAHWFSRHVVGQRQRKHTGWLDSGSGDRVVYAPHTESGYSLPPWRFAYNAGAGFVTRRGLREARRTGFLAH